jgi:hypothetical protein
MPHRKRVKELGEGGGEEGRDGASAPKGATQKKIQDGIFL